MTAWTTISNALVAVGAKPFATTMQALRDNVISAFEGDATASAVGITLKDTALDTGAATAAGRDWVGKRTAILGAGAVGSYTLASNQAVTPTALTTLVEGTTVAGSSLLAVLGLTGATSGAALTGTWRSMGVHQVASVGNLALNSAARVTLFLRIS